MVEGSHCQLSLQSTGLLARWLRVYVLKTTILDQRMYENFQFQQFWNTYGACWTQKPGITFRDKKDTGQEQIVSELFPVSELQDLAPLELISES